MSDTYKAVVDEFAQTLRRDGETFTAQFKRIAEAHAAGSLTKADHVWSRVCTRARGMAAAKWLDSYQDKGKLVEALRKPSSI